MSTENLKKIASQKFGKKLHELRVKNNMTLKTLAIALGHVAHSYISEIEAGKKIPTVEFVLNVSRLFNVTTDQLLKDELELDLESSFLQKSIGE